MEGSKSQAKQEATREKEIETAESHQTSQSHLKTDKEFKRYKDIYLTEIYPCLKKQDELRKMLEDVSSSGEKRRMDGVSLDLERLEECRSIVVTKVQSIESSLNWTNTRALLEAIVQLKSELQKTGKVLEQGIVNLKILYTNSVS